jgi:hypothetical protein
VPNRTHTVALDIVEGALAGAAGTWALDRVTTYLYEAEPRPVRKREDRARGGETAYAAAAEKLARAAGRRLNSRQRERIGTAIHWTLGIGAGALYGALRPRVRPVAVAWGLAYGALVWLLLDEGATTALGLTPGPTAFPWQTHARGLAGHLAYGAVANTALKALSAVV